MELHENATIIKAFNNNIVYVKANGKEKILYEKGIGFSKKFGEVIPKGTKVDKIFIIENEDNLKNFNRIISNVDREFLALCEEIIYDISKSLNEDLNEVIHIGLIDHLNFAVKRLKNGEEIENPFIVEVETLYTKEFDLAEMAARKISEYTNVDIPVGEVGFIALHIHSARNNGKLSNTIKYSYLANTIVEYVEDELDVCIDRRSLDYARFLTHIRFAIERIMTKQNIKNDLIDIIKIKYSKSYKISKELAKIIEENLDVSVTEDEVAYMAMHIERFRVSVK